MKKIAAMMMVLLVLLTGGAWAESARGSFRLDTDQGGAMGITFINVRVDEAGEVYDLWPSDQVTDVVLEKLDWDGETVAAHIIWTNEEMISNHVIALQTLQSETIPGYRITAVNQQGQRERWYIAWSGEDGAPLLLSRDEVEGALPIVSTIPAETEARSAALQAILEGDYPLEAYEEAARELAELWENERIRLWGGYAMSYAEQRWEAERAWRMLVMTRDQEEEVWYPMLLNAAYGELTRSHVLTLMGIEGENR